MTLRLLYFAALADRLNCREETVNLPGQVTTLGELQQWLTARGDAWLALGEPSVRMACNQTISRATAKFKDGDEVAFFPPVTGG